MFDMSWGEVMVIGAVALIVIGPKDLPKALRTLGNMTSKVRRMAAEFQNQFNDAMREAELDEIRKQVESVNQSVAGFNPIQTVRDELKGAIEAPAGASPKAAADAPVPAAAEPHLAVAGPLEPLPIPLDTPPPQVETSAPAADPAPTKPDGARA